MKNRIPISLLVLILILSCNKKTQTLDFKTFTIEVPKNWIAIKEKGIDSYIGRIAIDNRDTLSFDLGWYSNDLKEEHPFGEDTVALEKRLKSKRSVEIVDNKKAVIIKPKKTGIGTTGIYIDSLWTAGSGIDKFQLNGHNLKPENERIFLDAIRTVKFHKKND
ncbi:hypothetical protein EZ428_23575 [Pedobacter frigiditerrae]|uniref:Uncharacterized protein n=1 Tax=Pedobacter frigiditerrae TaxID=2530452 RepID=A0A4R0MIR1_9SPHI|nr:hypothetical protein [Pedobacter frigiditerrae]TCC86450.1 hypothetical protein EZ428_23575 [Pedobacter frigiditerrae]